MKAKAKAKKVANITDPSSTATASPSKAVKLARKKKKVDHPGTVDASRMKPSSPVA
jgi:hypothetical protein